MALATQELALDVPGDCRIQNLQKILWALGGDLGFDRQFRQSTDIARRPVSCLQLLLSLLLLDRRLLIQWQSRAMATE